MSILDNIHVPIEYKFDRVQKEYRVSSELSRPEDNIIVLLDDMPDCVIGTIVTYGEHPGVLTGRTNENYPIIKIFGQDLISVLPATIHLSHIPQSIKSHTTVGVDMLLSTETLLTSYPSYAELEPAWNKQSNGHTLMTSLERNKLLALPYKVKCVDGRANYRSHTISFQLKTDVETPIELILKCINGSLPGEDRSKSDDFTVRYKIWREGGLDITALESHVYASFGSVDIDDVAYQVEFGFDSPHIEIVEVYVSDIAAVNGYTYIERVQNRKRHVKTYCQYTHDFGKVDAYVYTVGSVLEIFDIAAKGMLSFYVRPTDESTFELPLFSYDNNHEPRQIHTMLGGNVYLVTSKSYGRQLTLEQTSTGRIFFGKERSKLAPGGTHIVPIHSFTEYVAANGSDKFIPVEYIDQSKHTIPTKEQVAEWSNTLGTSEASKIWRNPVDTYTTLQNAEGIDGAVIMNNETGAGFTRVGNNWIPWTFRALLKDGSTVVGKSDASELTLLSKPKYQELDAKGIVKRLDANNNWVHANSGRITTTGRNSIDIVHRPSNVTIYTHSIMMGTNVTPVGNYSIGIGTDLNVSNNKSITIGYGLSTTNTENQTIVLGTYNNVNVEDRALVIGNGTDDTTRSNLISIDKVGNVQYEGEAGPKNSNIDGVVIWTNQGYIRSEEFLTYETFENHVKRNTPVRMSHICVEGTTDENLYGTRTIYYATISMN